MLTGSKLRFELSGIETSSTDGDVPLRLYLGITKVELVTLSKSRTGREFDVESILHGQGGACESDVCAVIKAVKRLGSEWRILLAYYLLDNPLRFNDLLRKGKPDDLNARTLSRTLKYLQKMGIVERTVVGTEPFSVVYSLTEKGQDLGDILSAYRRWGEKWTPSNVHSLPDVKVKAAALTR
jgi:DNA-binding HxlR family transcriptional regulator